MWKRSCACLVVAAFAAGLLAGCKKSGPGLAKAEPPSETNLVLRLHWVGKSQVAADPNGSNVLSIWNLPETQALQAQTLGKLAVAPWRAPGTTNLAVTNAASALLRPLLEDLLSEESFIEIRGGSNRQAVLAIRLDEKRAATWKTNLAGLVEALWAVRPAPNPAGNGWLAKVPGDNQNLELTRAGAWTLMGIAQQANQLIPRLQAKIQESGSPSPAGGTNAWLSLEGDLAQVESMAGLGLHFWKGLPQVKVFLRGEGGLVRTTGELRFPQSLGLSMNEWQFPTNLVRGSLGSLAAVRGLGPWLGQQAWTHAAKLEPAPDQVFSWSQVGTPSETYVAASVNDAAAALRNVSSALTNYNSWVASNTFGALNYVEARNELAWRPFPAVAPTLQTAQSDGREYLLLSFAALREMPGGVPPEMAGALFAHSNAVYFGWENTESRMQQWMFIGQLGRIVAHRKQLPTNAVSLAFALAATPKLGGTGTEFDLAEPDRLTFSRKSVLGLSAIELHLLFDWLESPEFPRGLYTLLSPAPRRPVRPPGGTNAMSVRPPAFNR